MSAVTSDALPGSRRHWALSLHAFTAFMILSFGIKGLYFILSDDATFVLTRYPRAADLPYYVTAAMLLAAAFIGLIWFSYSFARRKFSSSVILDEEHDGTYPFLEYALVVVALVLIASSVRQQVDDVTAKLRDGTVLYRGSAVSGEDYVSGDYGVTAFFDQICHGLFTVLMTYAVIHRKYVLGAIAFAHFVFAVLLSDGSRFTLIGSAIVVPLLLYIIWIRRDSHYRFVVYSVYGSVFLLPALAGPLLLWRTENGLIVRSDFQNSLVRSAMYTFDGLDHLVNYLYLLPIDWRASRALEEFWKFFPRKFVHDKPSIFGELALQEIMYPHTVGAGSGYLVLGHYPLSNIVQAIDACGPVGFVVHGVGTGILLAWLDSLLKRRTTLAVCTAVFYLTTSYHLVRVGLQNYLIASVAPFLIPLGLFGAALKLAQAMSRSSKALDIRRRDVTLTTPEARAKPV
jgi:hypothetical protein